MRRSVWRRRDRDPRSSRRTALATAGFAGIVALAAVFGCLWLARRDLMQKAAVAEERARLLQREQEARSAAENANRMKDEFLAKLSHELRNPLHAVMGWLQMLQQRPDDAGLRRRAARHHRAQRGSPAADDRGSAGSVESDERQAGDPARAGRDRTDRGVRARNDEAERGRPRRHPRRVGHRRGNASSPAITTAWPRW